MLLHHKEKQVRKYLLFLYEILQIRESNKAVVNEDLNGLQSRRRPKRVERCDRFPSGSPHKEHRKVFLFCFLRICYIYTSKKLGAGSRLHLFLIKTVEAASILHVHTSLLYGEYRNPQIPSFCESFSQFANYPKEMRLLSILQPSVQ